VIPYNNATGQQTPTGTGQSPSAIIPPSSSSLLGYSSVPPGQPPTSVSSVYPGSSLQFPPKIPGLVAPPSSWPPPPLSTNVSSPVSTLSNRQPTPTTPTSNSAQFGPTGSFAAPLPPPAVQAQPTSSVNSHPFSTESLLTNKGKDFSFIG
jgi:hypothetical protein